MTLENDILLKIEGMQTVDTVAKKLGITRQSALNLVSRLKSKGYVTTEGGGRQKRIYSISVRKQRPRQQGMFDIINRHSRLKISPWYDHQVHGAYSPEDAIIDALETRSFRVVLASMRLFGQVRDWPRLYRLANDLGIWQKVGALYDLARLHFRVRRMPDKYRSRGTVAWQDIITMHDRGNFPSIQDKWKVLLPFNERDLEEA